MAPKPQDGIQDKARVPFMEPIILAHLLKKMTLYIFLHQPQVPETDGNCLIDTCRLSQKVGQVGSQQERVLAV